MRPSVGGLLISSWPICSSHGDDLWRSIGSHDELWGGIPSGPFATEVEFLDWLAARVERDDQRAYAIIDKTDGGGSRRSACSSCCRCKPDMGTAENWAWSTVPP
jgi:hypothetical protein